MAGFVNDANVVGRRDAISGIESGGRYDILGPVTGGDQAIGRYQVMGKNVGPWTLEALGKAMTPEEFRRDPKAQDAVFDYKFDQYVKKYGNEGRAASTWFSGSPDAGDVKDVLGTTARAYVEKYNKFRGTKTGESPDEVPTEMPEAEAKGFVGQAGRPSAAIAPDESASFMSWLQQLDELASKPKNTGSLTASILKQPARVL